MKRVLAFILFAVIPLTLTACGKVAENQSQSGPSGTPVAESALDPASVAQNTAIGSDEPHTQPNGILIAYFSRTGNTKTMAEQIRTLTGGELFEIKTARAYPDDYSDCLAQASEELAADYRPELSAHVGKMDDYDVIFIGYPIWHGNTPMAIRSFLEEYNFSGKTVIPFCTSGSSSISQSVLAIWNLCPASDVLDGLCITNSNLDRTYELVEEWIGGLNIEMSATLSETDANDNKEAESSAITSIVSQSSPTSQPSSVPQPISEASSKEGEKNSAMPNISITIGNSAFSAKLSDNDAARALLAQFPLTLNMSELNGNEKYCYLPDNLPADPQRVGNIKNGDLMLYGADCLVLFYESFSTSYSYTRLGYVEDASGLAAALGSGSVNVTFDVGN